MVQLRTMLKVADNSGAKLVQCIQILGGSRRRYGQLGDIIIATVKEVEPRRLVKKHQIVKAVIIRQKKSFKRSDGSFIRFDDNAVVILETEKEPKGSRIFGPVARELKEKGFEKIANLAEELV